MNNQSLISYRLILFSNMLFDFNIFDLNHWSGECHQGKVQMYQINLGLLKIDLSLLLNPLVHFSKIRLIKAFDIFLTITKFRHT